MLLPLLLFFYIFSLIFSFSHFVFSKIVLFQFLISTFLIFYAVYFLSI